MRALVVSGKFLFGAVNIVPTSSRRTAQQARNAKEPVQDQYQNGGGLLYPLARKCAVLCVPRGNSPEQTSRKSGLLDTNTAANAARTRATTGNTPRPTKFAHAIESLLSFRRVFPFGKLMCNSQSHEHECQSHCRQICLTTTFKNYQKTSLSLSLSFIQ